MPRTYKNKRFKRSLDFDQEFFEEFDQTCKESGISLPAMINNLVKATIELKSEHGYLPMPFCLVFKRDYEEFQRWKAGIDPGKSSNSTRKTA